MEHPARKDFLEGTFTLGDDTRITKKANLDSREVAPLRAVARVGGLLEAEEEILEDVEESKIEDLGPFSATVVSIERPSPEASSIVSSKLKLKS